MIHLPALFFAMIWIWSDLIGVLLSVISTYFYFGWEGAPMLVPKIFGIAMLSFSGPLAYRLLLYKLAPEKLARYLTLALFSTYVALATNRQSDFFAWGTVFGVWLGGIAIMSCLRSLKSFSVGLLPLFTLQIAFFFYLSTRISLGGLPLLLTPPQSLSTVTWAVMGVLVLAGMLLPQRLSLLKIPQTAQASHLDPASQDLSAQKPLPALGLVFGLLMGLSVGLIQNLHIWSANTAQAPAAVYFLSLSLGALIAGLLLQRTLNSETASVRLLIIGGTLGIGLGLYTLLNLDYSLSVGLLAHGLACLGLSIFWGLFLVRFARYQKQSLHFPWVSLQLGLIGLLLILAIFLLESNPNGFWIALAVSAVILYWQEQMRPESVLNTSATRRIWIYACALFALMGGVTLIRPIPGPAAHAHNGQGLKVMSSNIRYGWTDDYRFEPMDHLRYLRDLSPDLMGLQEVNKGHTSGAYSDLFLLYQRAIPGQWFYGDANYGFGNALFSRLAIDQVETRTYQAKDILRRSCLVASAIVNQRPVKIFVTHFSHLPDPNPVRQAQVQELLGWLSAEQTPWILLGDFNATPDSLELAAIEKLAHPALGADNPQYQDLSYPSVKPDRRIDYIFFSPDFEIKDMKVLENGPTSDHRPVWAEINLPALLTEKN